MARRRPVAVYLFSLVLCTALATGEVTTPAPSWRTSVNGSSATDPYNNTVQFIRTSCSTTLYRRLCFNSLIRYASTIRAGDSVQLAAVATNVSLARVRRVRIRIDAAASPTPPASLEPSAAEALGDCTESLSSAEDLTTQAGGELAKLLVPGAAEAMGPGVEWSVDNARTWLSAALTDEETCTDDFTSYSPMSHSGTLASLKGMVVSKVGKAKKFTSNALALVTSLVNEPGN